MQARLQDAGLRARNFALTNDAAGDAQLERHLIEDRWDGVIIGSYISGQDQAEPPTAETTEWFNRILNIVHGHAPTAKIVLVRDPAEALDSVGKVLGSPPQDVATAQV